jgi:uncharacterized membrane protein YebE (DUF533 family)
MEKAKKFGKRYAVPIIATAAGGAAVAGAAYGIHRAYKKKKERAAAHANHPAPEQPITYGPPARRVHRVGRGF